MRMPIWIMVCVALLAACSDDKPTTNANNTTNTNNTTGPNNTNGTNNTNGSNNGTNNMTTVTVVDAEFGLDARPSNTTCVAPERPTATSGIVAERVFGNLSFSAPVWAEQAPGDLSRWYVIEQSGVIRVFENTPDVSSAGQYVDLRDRVVSGGERGLLGMAFHPDWPNVKKVYVSYTANDNGLVSRISELTPTADGTELDKATERIILSTSQPFTNHNGGQISFGPDGFLYISLGDGGSANDPNGNGQNVDTLLGSMLRIDVNTGDPYGIPSDNPFAAGGGRPEIYAWGLRNVWRFSFDRDTGTLWAGDVGQNQWEEVDIIRRGGNYGWNDKEGFHCFGQNPCDNGPWLDPETEYSHANDNKSITGGFVYRGTAIPELVGTYIFADYVSGRIWALEYDADNKGQNRLLLETGRNVASFAQDLNGELYFIDYAGGIYAIKGTNPMGVDTFPKTLSATGCVDANDPRKVASGLIPYAPVAPFWSDGAEKLRWFALPEGGKITVKDDGDFDFPIGTVIVKSFKVDGKFVETRLLVRHDDGEWAGYSYEWRNGETDADLLPAGKVVELPNQQKWIYPSRGECMTCHTAAAGRTLGPEVRQLNADFVYTQESGPNRRSNQMATLGHIGVLENPPADLASAPRLVDPFNTADTAAAADAYMHTNCAGCHRSDAALRVKFDFRSGVAMADRGICNVDPVGSDLGVDGAKLLVPGQPDLSLMTLRAALRDANGMPPLGSDIHDAQGVSLLQDWITSVQSCD
ncbi:MAG: PQQ-dependent sugar dehydrogenase [bacterium]